MLLKNIAHNAVLKGHTVLVVTAAKMLGELAAIDSPSKLERRIKLYVGVRLLGIDELGYLSYDSRAADLLFEIVTKALSSSKTDRPHHQPCLQGMDDCLPTRHLHCGPRRSTHTPRRHHQNQRQKLAKERSTGTTATAIDLTNRLVHTTWSCDLVGFRRHATWSTSPVLSCALTIHIE